MVGRFTVSAFLALACLSNNAVQAQQPNYGPAAGQFGPPGMVPAPQYADGVMPAGYGQPVSYGGQPPGGPYGAPQGYAPPQGYVDPAAGMYPNEQYNYGPGANYTEERLPDDKGWGYEDSPLDIFLWQAVKNSWIRLEYLNWSIKNPGSAILGAPLMGDQDPRDPFPVTIVDPADPLGNPIQFGEARVFELGDISLANRNGIRGTLGIPLTTGISLEANYFALENTTSLASAQDLPSPNIPLSQILIATSTFTNNQLGTNTFLYDRSFDARYSTQTWGSEFNVIMDAKVPGNGFTMRPLAGFRFMRIDEGLTQVGVFDQLGALATPLVSTIDSRSHSNIYAPQIGFRAEIVSNWFTIGVEPKVAFGVNNYDASVRTENLRFTGDPTVYTEETSTVFSPVGEIQLYSQVNVNENFSLFISYDLILAGRIARPYSNINYNDGGVGAAQSGIVVSPQFEEFYMQGLTVGGEVRFR